MTTDILIPLGVGSRYNNLEIRFCLRSIEKHLKGVGNIFIVGDKPDFIKNVIHIPCRDNPNNWKRAENIYRKIMAGINYEYEEVIGFYDDIYAVELTDNFLFMNDDHFLLSDYKASELPYYHRGIIETNRQPNEAQRIQYENTVRQFNVEYDFGVHCPILYNKKLFQLVFKGVEWTEQGYEIKSAYANSLLDTYNCVPCEDLKFTQPAMKESIYLALEGRNWFSIGDVVLRNGQMQQVLEELYPLKSKYETDTEI